MFSNDKHIHFVGIGGIGMSGIAEVLINLGFEVTGSDIQTTGITRRLERLGAVVYGGHARENVKKADIVVISSAIPSSNPEIVAASERGIPVIPRSDMLGELMTLKDGIAVAGAHGKTTTTSIAAEVMDRAGLDPTVIIGGKVEALGINARLGEGKFILAEVDESDGNFVRLSPDIALITNVDLEHLNFYGSLDRIYDAFIEFASGVPFHGNVICCSDDNHLKSILPRIDRNVITYGLGNDAKFKGIIREQTRRGSAFSLVVDGEQKGDLFINMPGRYNVLNALGVCALAEQLGIGLDVLRASLKKLHGVGRRFEIKGEAGGVLFIDDYAHHPTEIEAVIGAVRKSYDRRLVVIFQPHRYTRTRDLHSNFDRCFVMADQLFIMDIYPASENKLPGVSGELIYRAALKGKKTGVNYVPGREDIRKAVTGYIREKDLVLTLGAGDVYRLGEEIMKERGV